MCKKCGIITLSAPNLDGLEPELKRVAKLLYDGKLKPGQIDKAMVKKIADQLMKGIFKGYGKDLKSKNLTPDERSFLNKLNENVHVFSGFKNYQQLQEITSLIKDDSGIIKPFNDWYQNDVLRVNKTYNEVYANAEYGNCISSGQNAASWQDFITNGVETLTLQTANDDSVRPEHAMLDGMTVDIDDPILDTLYTPLDWGCRCEWVPGAGKELIPVLNYELPTMPPMFKNNVGKTGVVFPDTHPYYDVSKAAAKSIRTQVKDILNDQED